MFIVTMEVHLQKYYRIKRAAELLGISKEHVYKLAQQGKLKISNRKPYRISEKEMKRYVMWRHPYVMFLMHDLISQQYNEKQNPF